MQNSQESQTTASVSHRRSFLPSKAVACHRCHAKKIKCTGGRPCQNCLQAEQASGCVYPQRNRKVKVPQSFIDGLFEEIDCLRNQGGTPPAPAPAHLHSSPSYLPLHPLEAAPRPAGPAEASNEERPTNLDQNEASWFDSRNILHAPILISEAADAAFATRFRQVISDPRAPEPIHLLRMNYANNEALMALVETQVPWPSHSRARFLLEAALKYIRFYYIVRGDTTREDLSRIFLDSTWGGPLLRCKFWAIFALGELHVARSAVAQTYPGMAYFAQASKMLGFLEERPGTETIETLLLLSMYSLAVNRRYSAYILSGTAMRSAIVMGLHLSVPKAQIPDSDDRKHRERLFWTAYMFDRMWGANLGHPSAIQDDEIQISVPAALPSPDTMSDTTGGKQPTGDDFDTDYHGARTELARLLSGVGKSVYGFRRQEQDLQLSMRVQQSMQDLQAWVDRLPPRLQIDLSIGATNDSKVLSLHLSFYQCVILATRPILLHTLRVQIAPTHQFHQIPVNASALSEACIRCARHSTQLLSHSWLDGAFVTFDCFFTQYLFTSLTILAISGLLDGQDNQADDRSSFEEASRLLTELKDAGNCVAQEYCHHVEAIQTALSAYAETSQSSWIPGIPTVMPGAASKLPQNAPDGTEPAVGPSWTESSLQQLLSQPALGLQFLEDAVRDPYEYALYGP